MNTFSSLLIVVVARRCEGNYARLVDQKFYGCHEQSGDLYIFGGMRRGKGQGSCYVDDLIGRLPLLDPKRAVHRLSIGRESFSPLENNTFPPKLTGQCKIPMQRNQLRFGVRYTIPVFPATSK